MTSLIICLWNNAFGVACQIDISIFAETEVSRGAVIYTLNTFSSVNDCT